jgi:predicted small secreted protein
VPSADPSGALFATEIVRSPLTPGVRIAGAAQRACKRARYGGGKCLTQKDIFDGTRGASSSGCGARPGRLARQSLTKGDIMKRFIALALAATFALPSFALLTGCNTVEGAGKDIQAGGAKIKEEAKENKKY